MGMAQEIGAPEPFDRGVGGGGGHLSRRFVHDHFDEQFRGLPFRADKILGAVQAEQPCELRVIPLRQQLHPPAQRGGCEAQSGKGVPHVVLAVAKGPFTVFPCLAPGDGRETDAESGGVGFAASRPARPLFQGVMQRRVVIDTVAAGQPFQGGQDGVGFGRMQVAAGRVDPQIPARAGNLLPGGETQGQFEEPPDRARSERPRRHRRDAEQGRRRRCVVGAGQRQREHRSAGEAAEWVRLARPVEATRPASVALGLMLGPVVIGDDVIDRIRLRRIVGHHWVQAWSGRPGISVPLCRNRRGLAMKKQSASRLQVLIRFSHAARIPGARLCDAERLFVLGQANNCKRPPKTFERCSLPYG